MSDSRWSSCSAELSESSEDRSGKITGDHQIRPQPERERRRLSSRQQVTCQDNQIHLCMCEGKHLLTPRMDGSISFNIRKKNLCITSSQWFWGGSWLKQRCGFKPEVMKLSDSSLHFSGGSFLLCLDHLLLWLIGYRSRCGRISDLRCSCIYWILSIRPPTRRDSVWYRRAREGLNTGKVCNPLNHVSLGMFSLG